jgi:dolichol-phosphate mannosyltransferase
MKKELLIVLPVYNEEKNLKEVIEEVKLNIDKNITDILAIDDGSTDKSSEILREIKEIKIIKHENNLGYGATLIEGFNYAIEKNYKYVITIDCDRQHQPKDIKKFFNEIKNSDYDIISGSRYLDFNTNKILYVPPDRYKINKKITEKLNRITNYNLTDSFCGFKAYKVSALKRLKLNEKGYGMPVQLWVEAFKNKLKVKEIAVELIYLDFTKNFNNNFKSILERYRYYLKVLEKSLKDENFSDITTS